MLNDLLVKFPELMLGSYPVLDLPDYKVKVTFESKDSQVPRSSAANFRRLASRRCSSAHRLNKSNGRSVVLGSIGAL